MVLLMARALDAAESEGDDDRELTKELQLAEIVEMMSTAQVLFVCWGGVEGA